MHFWTIKEGNQSDPNNYRLITLSCCFLNLLTVMLSERLKRWAKENNILTDAHFGFKISIVLSILVQFYIH